MTAKSRFYLSCAVVFVHDVVLDGLADEMNRRMVLIAKSIRRSDGASSICRTRVARFHLLGTDGSTLNNKRQGESPGAERESKIEAATRGTAQLKSTLSSSSCDLCELHVESRLSE